MKKTLIAIAAAAALTTSAFAEITFGAWLRVLPTLVANNGDGWGAGMANSWYWGARTARVDINAVSEDGNAGMTMGVYNDAWGGLGTADAFNFWVKPIDQVKLTVGKFDNVYRNNFTFGSWNWLRPQNWIYEGEGLTFTGFSGTGLLVEVFPIEGLNIFAGVNLQKKFMDGNGAWDAYKNAQIGATYTIDGVGRIQAKFVGKGEKTGDAKYDGDIEVAFDLTAVDNFYLTAGFAYYMKNSDYLKSKDTVDAVQNMKAALGLSVNIGDSFKISADAQLAMYGKMGAAEIKVDPRFAFGVGVDYSFSDIGLSLSADVRYLGATTSIDGNKVDNSDSISFLVGVNKSCGSNGSLGIAFQGQTHGKGFTNTADAGVGLPGYSDKFAWVVPISMSVWF